MCDHCGCRSYPAIAELTDEHDTILALAWEVATGTGEPRLRARAELLELLDRHVDKEERALYPLLVETGDLGTADREVLEAEHGHLRELLAEDSFDRQRYYELASHAEEEESELFPMAMFGFDDQDWQKMSEVRHRAENRR